MTTIKDLVHKRVLVAEKERGYSSESTVKEILIMEVSPSGNFTKIRDMDGRRYWKHTSEITPIEVLLNLEKSPS